VGGFTLYVSRGGVRYSWVLNVGVVGSPCSLNSGILLCVKLRGNSATNRGESGSACDDGIVGFARVPVYQATVGFLTNCVTRREAHQIATFRAYFFERDVAEARTRRAGYRATCSD
jgi:hypothetical protein